MGYTLSMMRRGTGCYMGGSSALCRVSTFVCNPPKGNHSQRLLSEFLPHVSEGVVEERTLVRVVLSVDAVPGLAAVSILWCLSGLGEAAGVYGRLWPSAL